MTPQTKILLLCNPNNPTGSILPAAEMDRLVESLPDHVLIISDEVYFHYVTDPNFPNSVNYVLAGKPIVLIQTFSKAYGLAGLRLGYAISPPEIANFVGGAHRGFHQNRLSLAAGVAALADQEHLQNNIETTLDGKQWLCSQFDKLGLRYIPSQTSFIVVKMPSDAAEIAKKLLPYGVMVRPLPDPGLENTLRVSVSIPAANQRFIQALQEILEE